MAVIATAKGWPAAEAFCSTHFQLFADQPSVWRAKALIFSYGGDIASFQKATAQALDLARSVTNLNDQVAILEATAYGPLQISAAEAANCERLIQAIDRELPQLPLFDQRACQRAIAAVKLRVGHFEDALARLERAIENAPTDADLACALALKGLTLFGLHRQSEAHAALEQAKSIMTPLLPKPQVRHTALLTDKQLLYLTLVREAIDTTIRK
jgi:tetratricopeptide (TPR) repeat protein